MCISAKKIRMGICMIDQAFNYWGSITDVLYAKAENYLPVKCK